MSFKFPNHHGRLSNYRILHYLYPSYNFFSLNSGARKRKNVEKENI